MAGGGKKVTIKDNFEAPQTNSKEAEDYLIKFREYSAKYPKAELLSYSIAGGENGAHITPSDYSKYYFDENANLTNILKNKVDYKFWGMLPEDTKIALYYKENSGQFSLYEKGLTYDYEKGLIKSKDYNKTEHSYLKEKMHLAVFNSTIKTSADTSKLNPPQTNTQEANKWKEQVTNKKISGYVFDSDGNITNDTKYTFWGATNDGKFYGLYYIYNSNWAYSYYSSKNFYIEVKTNIWGGGFPYNPTQKTNISTNISQGDTREAEKIIFPIKTNYIYDYSKTNTSTTTTENDAYKSKVAGKTIEEKDVMNTYTFLSNGDIIVNAYNGKTYTLHFWGAKDSTNGIYYVKINLKDIFGNVAPNLETYFYYGYKFDETTYKNRPILREYWQNHSYYDSFNDWHSNNFDKNGNPKNNIDWNSMPLQTTNINWTTSGGGLQDDIYLREK